MRDKIVMFPRGSTYVAAKIIKTVIEPLETGNGHQVVFFCQDVSGRRYRVPKSQVYKPEKVMSSEVYPMRQKHTKQSNRRR